MIFIICSFFLFGNAHSFDVSDLWNQKNFLISSFTNLDQLETNLTKAEFKTSYLKTYSNIFHASTNRALHNAYANLNGERKDQCLVIYENYVNSRNSSLDQANECYETVFRKFNFKSANMQDVFNNYKLFLQLLNITDNEIESRIKSTGVIIHNKSVSNEDSRKAYLDTSDFTLQTYLKVNKKYEVIYRNSRQMIELVEHMSPDLKQCEEAMSEQKEKLFTHEVETCANVVIARN
ncbi:uncharacterized protein LOC122513046 [Leptopilina heterotoma]|uniref:uncharacterized protein LOC122513046 n=1 Tax=Leptopilina heterotoma TaxID=63436 RepID=UPI001CA87D97|nr:uncharacterized protein LOC122513046 [Leptopilina heterotoma]